MQTARWWHPYEETSSLQTSIFATNVESESSESLGSVSREITDGILREMGVLPSS